MSRCQVIYDNSLARKIDEGIVVECKVDMALHRYSPKLYSLNYVYYTPSITNFVEIHQVVLEVKHANGCKCGKTGATIMRLFRVMQKYD